MIQRGIFLAIALLSIYGGMDTLAHARSAMHQIVGMLGFILGAILIVGAEIIFHIKDNATPKE